MRPRVGHIQFLNCLPLYYALVKNNVLLDIDLVKGEPRELSAKLISNELDIAPIPVADYARNYEQLAILPDLSISSAGAVKSILLFSKYDIKDLGGKLVALTNTSATSQVLIRIILEDMFKVEPHYFEAPSDLPQMMREADAALLIGDDALRNINTKKFKVYDLGELWTEHTHHTMVYAVWAVHKNYACANPEGLMAVARMLKESMEYSASHVDEIAAYAAKYEDFSEKFLADYFRTLRFDFSDKTKAGLEFFLTEAHKLRLIHKKAEITFAKDLICER